MLEKAALRSDRQTEKGVTGVGGARGDGTISGGQMATVRQQGRRGSHLKNDSHLTCPKIDRIMRGDHPRVLDLFASCGGLSLGFQRAGFQLAAAVEFEPHAAASHGRNFHGGDARHSKARDITRLPPEAVAADLDLGPLGSAIDVLIVQIGAANKKRPAQPPERPIHRCVKFWAELFVHCFAYRAGFL
jgi:C-5 cytosine-specific DNA methylase